MIGIYVSVRKTARYVFKRGALRFLEKSAQKTLDISGHFCGNLWMFGDI
jgi:hypothetical protein